MTATGFLLDRHDDWLSEVDTRSARAGLYAIVRAQTRRRSVVLVSNGRTEEMSSTVRAGVGMHLFTPEGRCAFGSIDGLSADDALDLADRTARSAGQVGALGAAANLGFLRAAPGKIRLPAAGRVPIGSVSLAAAEKTARGMNRQIRERHPALSVRTSLSFERDEWRVARSDGTDARWVLTRFVAAHAVTAAGDGGSFTCRATVSSPHFDALEEGAVRERLDRRLARAVERALALPSAPAFPSAGAVPLLIDHALAKGLAHEAFGHAAEADHFRSSVLARQGRFRAGERVGRDGVSVIDEPVRGDHADQPVSANGQPRRRVEIVRSGVLSEALADLFSAEEAGLPSTGAGRAGSFRSPPIPRMSNIRIEIADPAPLPAPGEAMGPKEVRDLAGGAGLLSRYPRVIYLAGYTGGQVNPSQGDFVFNCQALYELTARGATIYRPSVFRGSILAALGSLTAGFGPLCLDAIGTCGKWGQSVPSSGGSHGFVFIEPDPAIGLGS